MNHCRTMKSFLLYHLLCVAWIGGAQAAPPHPSLVENQLIGKAVPSYYMSNLKQLRAEGYDAPTNSFRKDAARHSLVLGVGDSLKTLAILVQFDDHPAETDPLFFDSLIYGEQGTTVRTYYREISYDQIDIVAIDLPSEAGWLTAPQPYSYYVNGQNGTGAYPRNTQKLVEDLIEALDPMIDFSEYDNDGDGFVDNLMVIHSGVGAEFASGSNNDIWSHKYAIAPVSKDNVLISTYTVQPEYWSVSGDMTIGIYAHELGHVFGLPDLYDTDYSSKGIGSWGIMGFGGWNGPDNRGSSPAHPCAWSRIEMGFTEPIDITTGSSTLTISNVQETGEIYKYAIGGSNSEYFLLEARAKIMSDSYLPADGLLIWHIDDSKEDNDNEWWLSSGSFDNYRVALEQADAQFDLEIGFNLGDTYDPFPGVGDVSTFGSDTRPASSGYDGNMSGLELSRISFDGRTAYLDLIAKSHSISTSTSPVKPESATLHQNYPNPFNPITVIQFSLDYDTHARLEIFNLLGQKVAELMNEYILRGDYNLVWNGQTSAGRTAASGVYVYKLTTGSQSLTRRMILVR